MGAFFYNSGRAWFGLIRFPMYTIQFTHRGEKDFRKLPFAIQKRISEKLSYYASLKDPRVLAKHLVNLPPATHRYRVGKYRVSFFVDDHTIFVERIELRGQAYRR